MTTDLGKVTAVILGGGAGQRLYPLTKVRAKPAVPLGGKYRLIDVPVSNCINSGIRRIFILTQYNSASLNRHIARSYRFSPFTHGFVEVLAAEITRERHDWFQGTADAVRQSLQHLEDRKVDTILVLSGDHLYQMDYRKFIARHLETHADITISAVAASEDNASDFGLLKIDSTGRITEFLEKPKGERLQDMRVDTTTLGLSPQQAAGRPFLASMGIYVFRADILRQVLHEDTPEAHDFGHEVIPAAVNRHHIQAYLFDGYWEDIGTIESFYKSHMEMTLPLPPFNFFDAEFPIYTHARFLPGSKLLDCQIKSSVIGDGCIIDGATITDSVIGIRSRVGHGTRLEGVFMIGADYYQTAAELQSDQQQGVPLVGVGPHCEIRRAIIDKNARVGAHVRIANKDGNKELDGHGYCIRGGIVVIGKDSIVSDGTVI